MRLKFITQEIQLIVSSITIIYYCSVRWLIDNLFLSIDKNIPFKYSLIIFPFVVLLQFLDFKNDFKKIKDFVIRLFFSYLFSLLFSLLIINSLQLYSFIFSPKKGVQKFKLEILEIEGINGRKRVHFLFKNKENIKKIYDDEAEVILKDGISLYCINLKVYKGFFNYEIIDDYEIKFCN